MERKNCGVSAVSVSYTHLDVYKRQVMQLTNGAPGASTETIGTTIYKTAFRYNNVGQGSAGAFIFFVVVSIVAVATMLIMRKQDN